MTIISVRMIRITKNLFIDLRFILLLAQTLNILKEINKKREITSAAMAPDDAVRKSAIAFIMIIKILTRSGNKTKPEIKAHILSSKIAA